MTYPFVDPSDDIEHMVADAYVYYVDPECVLRLPFTITWLYGFGSDPVVNPSVDYTPAHTADVVIHDADGELVFDSTADGTYYTWQPWTTRFRVHEWRQGRQIVRLVQFVGVGIDETPIDYPAFLEPDNGELHVRTVERALGTVTGVLVDGVLLESADVIFEAGYNIEFQITTPAPADGGRRSNAIRISATPGAGEGLAPGCEEGLRYVYTVAGARPNDLGYLVIDTDECMTLTPPQTILVRPGDGSIPNPVVKTAAIVPNILELTNDCAPCCSCDDFVAMYRALTQLNDVSISLVALMDAVKAQHQENIDRWNDANECRQDSALTVNLIATCGCRIGMSAVFCNISDTCISGPFQLRFTLTTALLPVGDGIIPGSVLKQEFYDPGLKNTTISGAWPVFWLDFNGLNQGANVRAKADLRFITCAETDTVTVLVEVIRSDVIVASKSFTLAQMLPAC